MNTSKEAAKKASEKEKTAEVTNKNFEAMEDLTEQEKEQMNDLPVKNEVTGAINVGAETLRDDKALDEIFSNMEKIATKDTMELTGNYIDFNEFKEGEERNYIFTGFTTFTDDKNETRPAVMLMDKERKSWVCASVVTVKALQKIEKVPCPVRIKVNGKVKGKNGSYFDVNVYIL